MADESKPLDLKINGIADPKCKCTPVWICNRCKPKGPCVRNPENIKFREPWNEAVKIDKGEKP